MHATERCNDPDEASPRVWLVGGTRPEAVKLAPLVSVLRHQGLVRPVVVATGQHPSMFHQGLAAFGERPDIDVEIDRQTGTQAELSVQLIAALDHELALAPPAAVVVQGDTSTALAAALSAFWRQIPIVHLEAGLRSYDLASPYPEEGNRRMIGQISALHLAPTPAAAANLVAEGIPRRAMEIVGNTVVDAALAMAGRDDTYADPNLRYLEHSSLARHRLMLVTMHRRESWGEPLRRVLAGVLDLLDRHSDLIAVLPAHPNPVVRRDVMAMLADDPRVVVTDPLCYPDLVRILERATLVLSDSGGIQEEAPTFGVPVLVLREHTERTEAIAAGCARLLGTDRKRIVAVADRLLEDEAARCAMTSSGNPFGDGQAGARSAVALARLVGFRVAPMPAFEPTEATSRAMAG